MKHASLLTYAFDFLRHPHSHFENSTHETAAASTEGEPALVFRGIRYHKEQAAADSVARPKADVRCVFRGIPYVRSFAANGTNVAARAKGVRIFRGCVVSEA